jgi:dihydroorotase
MPNTQPKTLSIPLLKQKFSLASVSSRANYSFYLGASNDNLEEMKKAKKTEHRNKSLFRSLYRKYAGG